MNTAALLAKRADHKTNHVLHLILCLPTAGLWIPVWIIIAIRNDIARSWIDRKLGKL